MKFNLSKPGIFIFSTACLCLCAIIAKAQPEVITNRPTTVASTPVLSYLTYQIKSKINSKILEVKEGSDEEGVRIHASGLKHSPAQRFIFVANGTRDYKIKATTGENLFLTVDTSGERSRLPIIQEKEYGVAREHFQIWSLTKSEDGSAFTLRCKAFPQLALEASNSGGVETVRLSEINGMNAQKWVLSPTIGPHPDESNKNLSESLWVDAKGAGGSSAVWLIWLFDKDFGEGAEVDGDNINVNLMYPQLRPVGHVAAEGLPSASYEILEGIVKPNACNPALSDFPISHYTHDFAYHVIPDKKYEYLLSQTGKVYKNERDLSTQRCQDCWLARDSLDKLLAIQKAGDPRNPNRPRPSPQLPEELQIKYDRLRAKVVSCPPCTKSIFKGYDTQDDIEVEWEMGIGQNNIAVNKDGSSDGFYTSGHKLKDQIWNWPSPGDWVHVEGMWSWERGHLPPHTEIHPASFVAVQRKVPVSFVINSEGQPIIQNKFTDDFFATRTDIYASGDGSPNWNNSQRESFSQQTDMNRKDYFFTVKHVFSKPTANAKLAWKIITRPGNSFPGNPEIVDLGNGIIQVKVPWKSRNAPDYAIFAKTILVYWDNPSSKGIKANEKPKLFSVKIHRLHIEDDSDPDSGLPPFDDDGEWRMYCNVGSDWLFLNEFCGDRNNILRTGLGAATGGYSTSNDDFDFEIEFFVYVLPDQIPRIYIGGWECDAIDNKMGNIKNIYTRNKATIEAQLKNLFTPQDILNGKIEDDPLGNLIIPINRGTNGRKDQPGLEEDGISHYNLIYTITELR